MSLANSRTPYVAQTPDRTHFASDIPLNRLDDALATTTLRPPSPLEATPLPISDTFSQLRTRFNKSWARCRETVRNNTGLLMVAASQFFGSTMSLLVKKLNSMDPPVSMLELIWVRMVITWTCCVTYMSIMKVPDPVLGPKGVRLLLVFRGVCGFFGLFGSYYSLQYLSLSDATVLQFLAPMTTAIVGAIILREDFNRKQALASICSLIGVVLIARPTFLFGHAAGDTDPESPVVLDGRDDIVKSVITPAQRLHAVTFAMIGVLGATGAYTSIRAIGKRAHSLHSIIAFSGQCVVTSTIGILIFRPHIVIPTRLDWIAMLFAIGFCGFGGQILMTMGLQRETAGRGTMAIYVQIIFATINDFIFFHAAPSILSILGTIIIMTSAIYVAVTKENPGAHKRNQSLIGPLDDPSLEEGLLANQAQPEEHNCSTEGPTLPVDDGKDGEIVIVEKAS